MPIQDNDNRSSVSVISINVKNSGNSFDVTSVGFDTEKQYTVSEFNQALKKANEKWQENWDGLSYPSNTIIVTVKNLHNEPCTYRVNLTDADYESIQDIVRLSSMPIYADIPTEQAIEVLNKAEGVPIKSELAEQNNMAEHIPQQQDISHNKSNADPTATRGESRGKVMEQERKTVFEVSSMTKLEGEGATKAIATLAVNGEFVVNGVMVNEKQDGSGFYVRMPYEQENGEYNDLVFPITTEAREGINNAVLSTYEQLAASPEKTIKNEIDKPSEPVSKVFAKMGKVKSNEKATIAAGQLTIDGCLVVKDVLLNKVAVNEKTTDGQEQPNAYDGQEQTRLIVAMPNKPSARSSHDDIAHAITPEFRAKIDKAVIAAANNIDRFDYKGVKYAELGNNPAHSTPLHPTYADKVMTELGNADIAYQAKIDTKSNKVVISVKDDDKQALNKVIKELDQKGREGGKKSLSERIDKAKEQQPEKPTEQAQAKQPHKKPKAQEL